MTGEKMRFCEIREFAMCVLGREWVRWEISWKGIGRVEAYWRAILIPFHCFFSFLYLYSFNVQHEYHTDIFCRNHTTEFSSSLFSISVTSCYQRLIWRLSGAWWEKVEDSIIGLVCLGCVSKEKQGTVCQGLCQGLECQRSKSIVRLSYNIFPDLFR